MSYTVLNTQLRWLDFAARNLLRNRRRSLVTLSIAALGTAAILVAAGFARYTYTGLAEASARSTGHLVLGMPQSFEGDEAQPLEHGLQNWQALREALLAEPEVRHVLPRVQFGGLISNGEKSALMMGVGISPDAEFAIKGPFLTQKSGQLLNDGERGRVLLGEGLARSLRATPGSGLTLMASTAHGALNAIDVRVAGVVSTGVPDLDQRLVCTDIATAQTLLDSDKVSSMGLFLERMSQTPALRERLQARWPALALKDWEQLAPFYGAVRQLYNRIFGALGSILALIVVCVLANAMAMSVIERTREIGTLRALGTRPGQLIASFATEGLLLGSLGSLLGALTALALSVVLMLVDLQMPPPPGRSQGYPLQLELSADMVLAVIALIALLALLCSAWVAARSVRQPIPQALAHV
ncbi:ABC transporter permease [Roseateles sp.]|jgi:putative ABC transport system permease protein|uniref:ABC transporter permease n=1 Tax=Roseateles sp. TaxID=1971397 RepID=UPI003918F7F5